MAATPKTMTVNSFALGMNNRAPDHKLRTDKGYFLRDAVNVDVTPEGSVRRRAGATLALAGADAHSLWSSDDDAFYVDGQTLYRLSQDLVATAVTTVAPGRAVSYFSAPEGGTYWTDGVRLERAVGASSVTLNPAAPNPVPVATAASGGVLPSGLYTVLFTAIDPEGRESAPTPSAQVLVPAAGQITITLSVAPTLPVVVYISGPDGETPYKALTASAAGAFTYLALEAGRQCPTYEMLPMPPGDIVRHFNGRLMVAAGPYLYFSEPYAPGLYRAESGFIPFQAPITVMEAIQGDRPGVYVCAEQTYWFEGDITKANVVNAFPYGGVAGTGGLRADKTAAHWMSPRGLVEASTGGVVKALQEDAVAVTTTSGGATLLRERNGAKQAVVALFGPQTHTIASATSYMDAEIITGA